MVGRQQKTQGSWLEGLGSLGEPIRAIKLGPSIVAVLATLGAFGLVAIGAVTFILSGQPLYALAVDALIVFFIWLLIRLLLEFTKANPVVAALGGGQLLQYLESQLGAKNPDIVIEHQASVVGSPKSPENVSGNHG
jgi:hypothetical protein